MYYLLDISLNTLLLHTIYRVSTFKHLRELGHQKNNPFVNLVRPRPRNCSSKHRNTRFILFLHKGTSNIYEKG
jgi:hypothetical protein